MNWIYSLTILSLLTVTCDNIHAGLFEFSGVRKNCECAESCQPLSCQPTISRPCHVNVYRYQRNCSNVKPSGCDSGGTPVTCCAPTSCGAPATVCGDSCSGDGGCCSTGECREIAELIQESKTGCYATHRRNAIHKLGDRYDCVCHPQIMNAFIYALNDSDERVRSKAADEIGDQIRRNRCICGAPVIHALQHTLADCDRGVRRQAEAALKLCGYKIVDGRCMTDCATEVSSTTVWSNSVPDSTSHQSTSAPWANEIPTLQPIPATEKTPTALQSEAVIDVPPAPADGDSKPKLTPSPSDINYDADPAEDAAKAASEKPQVSWFSSKQNHNTVLPKTGVLKRLIGLSN